MSAEVAQKFGFCQYKSLIEFADEIQSFIMGITQMLTGKILHGGIAAVEHRVSLTVEELLCILKYGYAQCAAVYPFLNNGPI